MSLTPVAKARAMAAGVLIAGADRGVDNPRKWTLDLNRTNDQVFIDVLAWEKVSIEAVLESGTWATAVVTLGRAVVTPGYAALSTPTTLTGPGFTWALSVQEFALLVFDVTMPEGAASEATFYAYGYSTF